MTLKNIKVGKWYLTNVGTGKCERVGGTFPPSVLINIVAPYPRGKVNVAPRDVIEEVNESVECSDDK